MIEELLKKRKEYMIRECPVYRLDCETQKTLYSILTNWNKRFGRIFREFAGALRSEGLSRCRNAYEAGKTLNPSAELPELTTSMFEVDGSGAFAAASMECVALDKLLDLYVEISEERTELETLFCLCFGAEAAEISDLGLLKVEYEPNKTYCLQW